MALHFILLLFAFSFAIDGDCVDNEEAAEGMIMPLVEAGAARFYGVDTNCVVAVGLIAGLCEMDTNPCCQTCADFANSDFHARIMLNTRYYTIDAYWGQLIQCTTVELLNDFIDNVAPLFTPENAIWNRNGIGAIHGIRDIAEFQSVFVVGNAVPETYFDPSQGACTLSEYWPETIIDENSELLISSRTPTFPFTSETTGQTGCLETAIDYKYDSASAVSWSYADIWVVDKQDVQRGNDPTEQRSPEEICDAIMENCDGLYEDWDDCVEYHTELPSYKDVDPKLGCMTLLGETRTCHSFWMAFIRAGIRPEYYCPRVGRPGPDENGVTWCSMDTCEPDFYYRQCYEALTKGEGMATAKWTQAGVDYTGRKAEDLAVVRGESMAGDTVTEWQYGKMERYLFEILKKDILECEYNFEFELLSPIN